MKTPQVTWTKSLHFPLIKTPCLDVTIRINYCPTPLSEFGDALSIFPSEASFKNPPKKSRAVINMIPAKLRSAQCTPRNARAVSSLTKVS